MEFEGVRPNPSMSLATSIWLLMPKYRMVGSIGSYHRDLHLKLYLSTEFDEIRRGPLKSESVADDLHLAPDAEVSYAVLNRLHHRNLRLKLYQNIEFDGIRKSLPTSGSVPTWRTLLVS